MARKTRTPLAKWLEQEGRSMAWLAKKCSLSRATIYKAKAGLGLGHLSRMVLSSVTGLPVDSFVSR